jgi:NTE family protein
MKKRIGVSLSGGGYRAAAFHLGTLRYLHKSRMLDKIDFLSTVSGGSIIGASYCQKVKEGMTFAQFDHYFKGRLQMSVIGRVLISIPFLIFLMLLLLIVGTIIYFSFFTPHGWLALLTGIGGVWLLIRFQFRLFPVSRVIEDIYDHVFFENMVLKDLPSKPFLIVNSTNLQSGRLFYFTPEKMSDSTYDGSYTPNRKNIFNHESFPLARAVMCSSGIPSFFTPVEITAEFFDRIEDAKKIKPMLIDGGVYDNQGIHKLTHPKGEYECQIVLVSDAGNLLPFEGSYNNVLTLLWRTVELFMNRIKMFQMMVNLYRGNESNARQIAYVTLGWDLDKLVPGFVQNIRNGNVGDEILQVHRLDDDFLSKTNDDELVKDISDKIGIKEILRHRPTLEQLKLARSVSTNLTDLSSEKIEALALYAEVMTEIQIKLYAPSLLINHSSHA